VGRDNGLLLLIHEGFGVCARAKVPKCRREACGGQPVCAIHALHALPKQRRTACASGTTSDVMNKINGISTISPKKLYYIARI
jgi:hypothetical protein